MRVVEIKYKCGCMKEEGSFMVVERGKDEELEDFMHRMRSALAADHGLRSPLCKSDRTEYVKVPYTEGGGVGTENAGNA